MVKYIPLDAAIAEIERIMNEQQEICKADVAHGKEYPDSKNVEVIYQLQQLIKSLKTLEVREVDLEKEIKEEYLKLRHYGGKENMLVILNEPQFNEIARRFFDLGCRDTLHKSSTLKVKEVDLEKEIDKFYGMYRKDGKTFDIEDNEECVDWKVDCNPEFEKAFARHFFKLGINAQKG